MSLRLSTGFCHGMRLEDPSQATRPTAARVRSAAWNALQDDLAGAAVLDVFSGSGAVGIEALSRGALSVTFVEKDRVALKALQQNLNEVKRRAANQGIGIGIVCIPQVAKQALSKLGNAAFDIVWMDPPFPALQDLLPPLRADLARVSREQAWLVVESDEPALTFVAHLFAAEGEAWELVKQKVYGKIGLSFFRKKPLDPA